MSLPIRPVRPIAHPLTLPPLLRGLALRAETPDDLPFIRALYCAGRSAEMLMAPPDWSDADKRAFLDSQFDLQYLHYARHYADADFMIVTQGEGQPIGRLYVHWPQRKLQGSEVRVVDVALVPAWQRRGIGSALVAAVQSAAALSGHEVTIHVEHSNGARRLYERLGFVSEPSGSSRSDIYLLMRSRPQAQGLITRA